MHASTLIFTINKLLVACEKLSEGSQNLAHKFKTVVPANQSFNISCIHLDL